MHDFGARTSAAVTPVIRGINASGTSSNQIVRSFEQSPVGLYFGNSPIDGYFQLDDIQRIEVLRGPQGTLYGAGALGGALRIIPNAPELQKTSGRLEASVGAVSHAGEPSRWVSGMLNVPMGDVLALRLSGKYDYDPGFMDVYGILKRAPGINGLPVLADPTDPVDSPAVFTGKSDWNFQETFTGRASLHWKPADAFDAELAFTYAEVKGDGAPYYNDNFPGGPYPIDPRVDFPRGGEWQTIQAADLPYERTTELTSLDLSYDAGFATVSATSSYYTTEGHLAGR
jgi:outer membrane receptor protein involved in Fe transport